MVHINDAIGKRTSKQWHAEVTAKKIALMEALAMVNLGELNAVFPNPLTGKELMEHFSKKQLGVLQRVGELSDLDTRRTVEHMLSEFTTEMSAIPSISERLTKLKDTWNKSLRASLPANFDPLTEAELTAYAYTVAWGGRAAWTAQRNRGGEIRLRCHLIQETLP